MEWMRSGENAGTMGKAGNSGRGGKFFLVVASVWAQAQGTANPPQTSPIPRRSILRSMPSFRRAASRTSSSDSRRTIAKCSPSDTKSPQFLDLKPGMAVADIGAGTGLFTRLFADEVGTGGKVYAVDVSKDFLDYIAAEARRRGQPQIETIRGTQASTNLPAGSVDVAFLCDVYHHLENHEKILATIYQALRPRGLLVLVEFDRVEGKSTASFSTTSAPTKPSSATRSRRPGSSRCRFIPVLDSKRNLSRSFRSRKGGGSREDKRSEVRRP